MSICLKCGEGYDPKHPLSHRCEESDKESTNNKGRTSRKISERNKKEWSEKWWAPFIFVMVTLSLPVITYIVLSNLEKDWGRILAMIAVFLFFFLLAIGASQPMIGSGGQVIGVVVENDIVLILFSLAFASFMVWVIFYQLPKY